MDATAIEDTIKFLLAEMHKRFEKAANITRAAQTCAAGGDAGKAVEIVLDVEQLGYEASNLLNAASTLNRISQE